MSVTYQVADGHDNVAGLEDIFPQPNSVGVVPGRRLYNAAGGYYEDGHYIEFRWPVLEDRSDYTSLLIQLGIVNAPTNQVTLRVRDSHFFSWLVNATVILPEHGREVSWTMPFVQRVSIIAVRLSAAS